MTNSKSGDILSACIAFAVSVSTLMSPESSQLMILLNDSGVMPEWTFVAAICSMICLVTTTARYAKAQAMAKFMSGCVWGSMLMLLGLEGQLFPLFWVSVVLFSFDVLTVITRSHTWSQRKLS